MHACVLACRPPCHAASAAGGLLRGDGPRGPGRHLRGRQPEPGAHLPVAPQGLHSRGSGGWRWCAADPLLTAFRENGHQVKQAEAHVAKQDAHFHRMPCPPHCIDNPCLLPLYQMLHAPPSARPNLPSWAHAHACGPLNATLSPAAARPCRDHPGVPSGQLPGAQLLGQRTPEPQGQSSPGSVLGCLGPAPATALQDYHPRGVPHPRWGRAPGLPTMRNISALMFHSAALPVAVQEACCLAQHATRGASM